MRSKFRSCAALFHGSSIDGARSKALSENQGTKYVAKFSSSFDLYSVVKAEFIAMRLAVAAGIKAAPVKLFIKATRQAYAEIQSLRAA